MATMISDGTIDGIALAITELETGYTAPEEAEYVRMAATLLGRELVAAMLPVTLEPGITAELAALARRLEALQMRPTVPIPALVPAVCGGCGEPVLGRYVAEDRLAAFRCLACRD